MKIFFVLFDLMMLACFVGLGLLFRNQKEKACGLIAGYNMKTAEQREAYDEERMSKDFSSHLFEWAAIFAAGAAIDFLSGYVGCIMAWIVWLLSFFRFMRSLDIETYKKEDKKTTDFE